MLFLMPLMNKLNESTTQAKTYIDMINIDKLVKEFKPIINAPEVKNTFKIDSQAIGSSIESIIGLVNKFKTQPVINECDYDSLNKKFLDFKSMVLNFGEKLVEIAPKITSLSNIGNPEFPNLLDKHQR